MNSPARHFSSRGIVLFALGIIVVLGIAWLMESLFFAFYHFQDWQRPRERLLRYFLESGYALRPAGLLLLLWGLLTAGGHALVHFRLPRVYVWGSVVIAALLILWPMIRVVVYYYMRLEVTFELAIYGLQEIRGLIFATAPAALGLDLTIPACFLSLWLLLVLWAVLFQRKILPWISPEPYGFRPGFAIVPALLLVSGPLLAGFAPTMDHQRIARPAQESRKEATGDSPFPLEEELELKLYPFRAFFQERFGFTLPANTNIVIIILESAREEFVDLQQSKYFAPDLRETLVAGHFFVPVPHSSNSHYSMLTGMHSERDFTKLYSQLQPETTMPVLLQKRGYTNYWIYTDSTAFESEIVMLRKLNMNITEKEDFMRRKNPETGEPYMSFQFGLDDVALAHETSNILDSAQEPFTLTAVMTNSHYPYHNPHPEKFNRFDNSKIKGRHRNGIDYGLHIADRIVEEFEKRGMAERTLFVLISDHGESFGERGAHGHSFSIYNEEVRVPLVFRHQQFHRVWQKDPLPRLTMLDLFPTIFDMAGLTYENNRHGRSAFDPDYRFHMPLWVWRVDDFRGYLMGDTKWIYSDPDQTIYRLDLHDQIQAAWKGDSMDGHADAFVEALKNLDVGLAPGKVATAGELLSPPLRMGPFAFGASFYGGGGQLYTDCDQLPPHIQCAMPGEEAELRGDPQRMVPFINEKGEKVMVHCPFCVGP
ncbi:MAG: sulfatase-like hydrolase/transferase [Leptospiraceae bacterium]|nr:sulfatase-like hydrolase/transferase [Leptospiraceae bacterium]